MATRILFRRDTEANWTSNNPTPAQGEIVLVTDTGRLKIGNGTNTFTGLAYFPDTLDAITDKGNTTTNGITVGASTIANTEITNDGIGTPDSSPVAITTSMVVSSGLTVGDHILPSKTEAIDLGSEAFRFRDLFLSGSTINLGGSTISVDGSSIAIKSGSNPIDIKVKSLEIGEGSNKITIRANNRGLPEITGGIAGTRGISTSVDSIALAIALS